MKQMRTVGIRRLGIAVTLTMILLAFAGAAPRPATVVWAAPRPSAAARPRQVGLPGPASTLLIEVSTGRILAATDPHRLRPPASLDKLMTFYLALGAIKAGRIALTTSVTISAEAWRVGRTPGSSRMFLNAGDTVTVDQLLHGLMIASGNDAAEALAETLAGSGEQFVEEMNATAARLGMRDTRFVTPHGLPTPGEHTSAWDMGHLARQIVITFPDALTYTSPRYEVYGGIRQANWNNLVFRDARVDGMKTGFTDESGYHIVATAQQGGLRFIAVVMGAHTLMLRTGAVEKLLNLGFARYEKVSVPWQQFVPSAIRVYGGNAGRLSLAAPHALEVVLPREDRTPITVSEEISVRPIAPFRQGQQIGTLTVRTPSAILATSPVVAAATVGRAGIVGRLLGMMRYKVGGLLHRRQTTWTGTFTPPQ
ncbi:MAG TPA: D-alanyl-D-alanine carboxypeptidase family protein [bacterium]|nr:D-alanyl-D-alanine carboxypeptidase family protein [bacterium]